MHGRLCFRTWADSQSSSVPSQPISATVHVRTAGINNRNSKLPAPCLPPPKGRSTRAWAGGTSFGKQDLGVAGFRLGGPCNLSAYGRNELVGDQYFILKAGYLHRLFDLPSVLGSVYGMTFYETAKVYRPSISSSSIPQTGSVAVIMKSWLGPVYAGGSFGDNGHRTRWFGIGRIF